MVLRLHSVGNEISPTSLMFVRLHTAGNEQPPTSLIVLRLHTAGNVQIPPVVNRSQTPYVWERANSTRRHSSLDTVRLGTSKLHPSLMVLRLHSAGNEISPTSLMFLRLHTAGNEQPPTSLIVLRLHTAGNEQPPTSLIVLRLHTAGNVETPPVVNRSQTPYVWEWANSTRRQSSLDPVRLETSNPLPSLIVLRIHMAGNVQTTTVVNRSQTPYVWEQLTTPVVWER